MGDRKRVSPAIGTETPLESDAMTAEAYTEQLDHPNPRKREEAIQGLSELGWGDTDGPLGALAPRLLDTHPSVRAKAADALGVAADAAAAQPLLQAIDDENREVRFRAAFALEQLEPPVSIDVRIRAWATVVDRDGQNVYALCNLSLAHRESGARETAMETAYRGIELHPEHFYPYLLVAHLYAERGEREAAVRHYKCAIRCNPEHATTYHELAELYRLDSDYEAAVERYQQAIDVDPTHSESYFGLGFCYNRMERYDEAIASYGECLDLSPDHYVAHNNLGMAHRYRGSYEAAMDCFKHALELSPDYAAAQLNLGDTFVVVSSARED
ncbi:MAG: tetratricopeptide repeat protein [Candidatus Poribacteria bacterium]